MGNVASCSERHVFNLGINTIGIAKLLKEYLICLSLATCSAECTAEKIVGHARAHGTSCFSFLFSLLPGSERPTTCINIVVTEYSCCPGEELYFNRI